MLKIICGVLIVGIALFLYVLSTSMVNKNKDRMKSGCGGGCAGCANAESCEESSVKKE